MGGTTAYGGGRPRLMPARANTQRPTFPYCRYIKYIEGDAVECGAEKPANYRPYCETCFPSTAPVGEKVTAHFTATASVNFAGSKL